MRIGFLLPNWIGDVAMATPTLRAVADRFGPQATLVGVMRPYVAQVLEGSSWLDEQILWGPKSKTRERHSWAVARALRARRLDALLLLTNSLRSGVVGWLSGARRRIGYARNGRGPLLTDALRPPRAGRRLAPVSAVDYYLELAARLGCDTGSRQLELATTAPQRQAADRVWDELGLPRGGPVAALCPSGAYGAAKHWPAEYFAELGRRLAEACRCHVLVVCGPAERETARGIAAAAGHPWVVSLADQPLSIGLTKECLRRSRLAVSTDSGPRHLAAGFGVATLALFGSTDPRWSVNYNPLERQLAEQVPCGPCAQRVCPLDHHRCMRELSVDRVWAAARSLWEEAGDKSLPRVA